MSFRAEVARDRIANLIAKQEASVAGAATVLVRWLLSVAVIPSRACWLSTSDQRSGRPDSTGVDVLGAEQGAGGLIRVQTGSDGHKAQFRNGAA